MRKNNFKLTQWGILVVAVILSIIGLIAIYSATISSTSANFYKQLIWLGISLVACIVVAFIDYEKLIKISPYLYVVCIALLIGVLFTSEVNGAKSWFNFKYFSFQPTELAKPVFILFTTFLIQKIQKKNKDNISKFGYFLLILVCTLPTIALIILQPDYGTAIAFIFALVFILIVARLDKKYFIIGIPLAIIVVVLAYMYVLPDHAKQRIQTFLDPESDPLGSGYNIIQSKLAIGAGELTGMGLGKGNQTQLGYLSPKTTDFIFSVIGEEMGFLGAGSVIICFICLLSMIVYVARTSKHLSGSLVTVGIFGIFFYHVMENIGMTIGLLPITGVPLPFVSYGGSSLLTNFICIGIILNVSSQRQKTIFVGGNIAK